MRFEPTRIPGVFELIPDRREDERGWFARAWCAREFEERGLSPRLAQFNVSYNRKRGTLRGMHYQAEPHEETKVIRVTRGAIYDVAVDLRRNSPTYRQWQAFELSAGNGRMVYLPEGIAHGFLTLSDDTELLYLMSQCYCADSARGVRWNDPAFGIQWPHEPVVISERDRTFEDFVE